MTNPGLAHSAVNLLKDAEAVLLDFDGPICRIFAGFPAPMVAAHLRDLIASRGVRLPHQLYDEPDPLNVFRFAATLGPDTCKLVEDALRDAEIRASHSAEPTPHAEDFMRAWRRTGRTLAVVSNNSQAAVESYLRARVVRRYVDAIAARTEPDPTLMKPNPHLVLQALRQVDATQPVVMIGDSESDIQSARAAGVPSIGYANKPGKEERLRQAGADAIIRTMEELLKGLAQTP
jgi:phosphoglycolate phosphatase